jgi:predicted acylesterase/phospholipase RssA
LEFTTNWNLASVTENLPSDRRPRAAVEGEKYKLARSIEDIKEAVFASMDLPPLFSYITIGDRYYEDGGVIDNLPIRFGTEFENCDLLFVLPLNANFEESTATMRAMIRSVVKRLLRVMNVRQGVLERNAFKMIYLYNELAGLREVAKRDWQRAQRYKDALQSVLNTVVEAAGSEDSSASTDSIRQVLEEALSSEQESAWITQVHKQMANQAQLRTHNLVQVFATCPAPELMINTTEFWKTQEAGRAFRLMYEATQQELERFFRFDYDPSWIRMAQVSPGGTVTYLQDF